MTRATSTASRAVTGAAAGLVSGVVVAVAVTTRGPTPVGLLGLESSGLVGLVAYLASSALLGAGFGLAVGHHRTGQQAATVANGLLLGLLRWIVESLTVVPLVEGRVPRWSLDEADVAFASLVGSLLYGGLAGMLLAALLVRRAASAPAVGTFSEAAPRHRVVIVGGGFAGVAAAQRLARIFARDAGVEITLVSQSNYLLFTPMLAEVASGALAPNHISAPLRSSCPGARSRRAEVESIDTEAKMVWLRPIATVPAESLPYDHLVLALGSVPDHLGLPGVEEGSFALKTLRDATALRNHAMGRLEEADAETDPEERRRQLTFVVAGGGFAGVEIVAELFDLLHLARRYYPTIEADELRFVLVHSKERILPEIGDELAAYALDKLRARGIEFILEARVAGATPEAVLVKDREPIPTRTLVWTAGNRPNPLLATLACERNRAGAVVVEPTLAVPGLPGVWAVGDGAAVPDFYSEGNDCPPTAQHALREGKTVGDNVAATLRGDPPRPFRFKAIGTLVALGHRTAVAEIRGRRFSGRLAWLMWRTIYLAKLPGLEKKVRVALDWTIDLFFPRDIAVTDGGGAPARTRSDATLEEAA